MVACKDQANRLCVLVGVLNECAASRPELNYAEGDGDMYVADGATILDSDSVTVKEIRIQIVSGFMPGQFGDKLEARISPEQQTDSQCAPAPDADARCRPWKQPRTMAVFAEPSRLQGRLVPVHLARLYSMPGCSDPSQGL